MYVIRGTVNGGTKILPADRCEWAETPSASGGYQITSVLYKVGASEDTVTNAQLGYVSKTGRFVAITNNS